MIHILKLLQVSEENIEKYRKWTVEQNAKGVEIQKKDTSEDSPFYRFFVECWEMGFPYAGAVGGDETVLLTPTSIGVIIKIENYFTKEVLDLTDYDEW